MYLFRNRFTTFNERLDVHAGSRVLTDTRVERVTLSAAAPDTLIRDSGSLVLEGSGYADESAALTSGQRWRHDLTVAFARSHIGTDFGADDLVTPGYDGVVGDDPPEYLTRLGLAPGDRIVQDQHGLLVVSSEPRPRFVHVRGDGSIRRNIQQFEANLNEARAQANTDWSVEKRLAHRLVSNALRDDNPETQHIQLVTAIEVLLMEQSRPPAVLARLNGLINEVEQATAEDLDVRLRLLQILRGTREESISRAASDQLSALLADEYLGKPVDGFFHQVYNMRSRLLHRKRRPRDARPSTVELGVTHFELLRMVLDFLAASD